MTLYDPPLLQLRNAALDLNSQWVIEGFPKWPLDAAASDPHPIKFHFSLTCVFPGLSPNWIRETLIGRRPIWRARMLVSATGS